MIENIDAQDREYLNILRGASIFRVVLAHLGLSWIYPPYSSYIGVFLPLLFFVSGAVSLFSYKRAGSLKSYYLKRLISISVPYFFIVFLSFLILFLYDPASFNLKLQVIFELIFFNVVAVGKAMPYPLGQVWFIHSLIIIIILTPIFFKLSTKSSYYLLLGVVISLTLGIIQTFIPVNKFLNLFGHNFYQPITNMGFFLFGSYYYSNRRMFSFKYNVILLISCIFIILIFVQFVDIKLDIKYHSYSPDFFYFLCSFSAIFLLLSLQGGVTSILNRFNLLKMLFIFMSKNSYSVFLLHSLVIYILEKQFGFIDVMNNPLNAFLKVSLTIIITCLISIPCTYFTNKITSRILTRVAC